MSALSQEGKVLKLLKQAGQRGVPNYVFPKHRVLCYTKVISRLRAEGNDIIKERLQLPSGRYTDIYVYILIEPKKKWWQR